MKRGGWRVGEDGKKKRWVKRLDENKKFQVFINPTC